MLLRVLLLCALLGLAAAQEVQASTAGCFKSEVIIRNPAITPGDPNYPIYEHHGYVWYVTPPVDYLFDTGNVTEKFVREAVMRLEINFGNPIAYTEVMIRRMHNLVEGPTDTSFTYGFLKHGQPYQSGCCLHATVDQNKDLNFINSSRDGSEFFVPRSDGWTIVELVNPTVYQGIGDGAFCNDTNTFALLNDIFYPANNYASWEVVNADCPLKCKVQANFVFVLDGSGSISGSEWTSLVNVLKVFVSNVQISSDATHVGFVYFSGQLSSSRPDLFCIVKASGAGVTSYNPGYSASNQLQFNNQFFKNVWSSAIVDDSWYSNFDWLAWNDKPGFEQTVCYNASFNTRRSGLAWVALYLSDLESLVSQFVTEELPTRPYADYTAAGTGIALGLELFDRPAVERPAVPEKMVVITDGASNRGQTGDYPICNANPLDPTNLRGISNLARLSGVEVFAVGIGNDLDRGQLNYIGTGCMSNRTNCFPGYTYGDGNYSYDSGFDDKHVFIASDFTLTALQPFLNQLLDVECIDASATGTLCSSDCGDNFCTTCGSCIQCTVHSECPQYPCQFCTAGLSCQLTSTTRVCSAFFDGTPTSCESYTCSRSRVPESNLNDTTCDSTAINPISGESYQDTCRDRDIRLACGLDLDPVKVTNAHAVCDRQGKTFVLDDFSGNVVCTCQSDTDHDTDSAALIAGTTAGGLFLLCLGCLLPCLLLLCLLAILIIVVLLVLLILIIIFLLVLLFGIRLAIPPKIHGIAVDDPTNVIAQENPLAKESGWQDAPQLE